MTRFFIFSLLFVSHLSGRIWTDSNGKTIDAKLVRVEHLHAFFILNGKTAETKVPVRRLSVEDRALLDLVRRGELHADETEEVKTEVPKKLKAPMVPAKPVDTPVVKLPPKPKEKEDPDVKANWDAPWPQNVTAPDDLEIIDVAGDPASGKFVYRSPHYEFICDVRLTKSVVRSFAKLFEATHRSMELLPFNFQRALKGGGDQRHKILLFETHESYVKNGGPPSSAGVYIGGRNGGKVMVPLSSLGVKPLGSGYTRDRKGSNNTLPHELVHQLTDYPYYVEGSRGWFTEGLAEFVAVSQMSGDRFNFRSNLDEVKDYATAYGKDGKGGRALGDEIVLPDLKAYMLQSYGSFTANANYNYGMGLLITAYFIHLEDDGDRVNIKNFLKAAREGKKKEELLEVLRAGRTWEEMAKDISKGWKRKGVDIEIRTSS